MLAWASPLEQTKNLNDFVRWQWRVKCLNYTIKPHSFVRNTREKNLNLLRIEDSSQASQNEVNERQQKKYESKFKQKSYVCVAKQESQGVSPHDCCGKKIWRSNNAKKSRCVQGTYMKCVCSIPVAGDRWRHFFDTQLSFDYVVLRLTCDPLNVMPALCLVRVCVLVHACVRSYASYQNDLGLTTKDCNNAGSSRSQITIHLHTTIIIIRKITVVLFIFFTWFAFDVSTTKLSLSF